MISMVNVKRRSPAAMGVLILLMVTGWACLAFAQAILPSPLLPPESNPEDCDVLASLYAGIGVQATFPGPIILIDPLHKCFRNVERGNDGMGNEIETFDSVLDAYVTVGSATVPVTLTGPVDMIVYAKIGHTTGTFDTEILSMSLVGDAGGTPVIIRESPTLASTGQTGITDIGGGLYQIDSFFDVFTELSVDGGNTFMPQQDGPGRMVLMQSDHPSSVEASTSWSNIKAMFR